MKAVLRVFLSVLLCAWLAACPCRAWDESTGEAPSGAPLGSDALAALEAALSDSARDTAGDLSTAASGDLAAAMGQLLGNAVRPAKTYLAGSLRSAAAVLIVCALCAGARIFAEGSARVLLFAGTAAIAAACLGSLTGVLALGRQALEELSVFGKTLLPTLCAAQIMTGAVSRAGVLYTAALFVCDLCLTLIVRVMTPLVYAYCALVTAHCISANEGLLKLSRLLKSGVVWALKLLIGVFTGYLAISGVISGASNAVTVKSLKLASGAIPLVGGVLSDAAETVTAGAQAVKGLIGAAGIAGILSIVLLPFLKLALSYALYKLAAVLSALTGAGELAAYAENLSEGFVLILSMCAACTLMVLIGVFAAILGTVGI